jgi:Tfp pilus assembly protein PilF/TolB-like protein
MKYYAKVLLLAIIFTPVVKRNKLDKSIAVLLPNYVPSNSDSTYFLQLNGTIGMIIDNLSKIKDLEKVIPWISVQQYVNSNKTAAEIAKELKVNYLITSSVIATEDGNYLNIMLINGKDGNQEWSSQYEMHSKEIIKLPTIIAHDIANNIHIEVTQQEKKRIEKIPTLNTEAYNLYLRGRFFWNTRTEDGIRTSVDLFRKAVEIDENYALAWSGLADAYCILSGYGWYTPKKEGEELAKKYARKAIEIDNNLAEAHTALGFLLCYNEWRWDEAEKELEEAIRLNPNYSFAHLVYALLHDIRGNGNKARDEINIALELDPFAPVLHSVSATLYYNEGNYDRSIQEYQEILKLEKNYTAVLWWLFKNYYRKGEGSNATDVLQKILRLEEHTAFYSDDVKRTYMNAGLEGVIESIIEITEEVKLCNPDKNVRLYWESYLPEIYAMSGRREEALTLLENYLEKNLEGDRLVRLINNPDYTTLRNEKRFIKVIDNLGLKEYYENSIENQKILSETN